MNAYNNSFLLPFERNCDSTAYLQYMNSHWSDSIVYSIVYIAVIFAGKKWMENRPRFDLRPCLATWSAVLGIFSLFGALRNVPELVSSVRDYGMEFSVCNKRYLLKVNGLWCCLFAISKVIELGDTVFIVLRKQQLIFLHWYHHVTVLIYVWYMAHAQLGMGRWFIAMNYTVHAVMYSYYALRAMKFRIPKFVSMAITSLQITQMVVGFSVTCYTYLLMQGDDTCLGESLIPVVYALLMYASYFVLFARVFYVNYLAEKPKLGSHYTTNGKKLS
ncbi:very long chain fatty acid elongase 6-like [Argopecten irradians]|uniref:very long chain fatty acid elongase 6-like n=1 Tax=Argopecten irradians TaxID=31199 RepID=UPI00371816B3